MADVVIVGGGSAGAVLAARLSEDPARTVLLLDAGPAYAPAAQPAALLDPAQVADPEHDWGYTSLARGRSIASPRGRVLGGSSAIIPDIPSTPTNLTVIMLAERIHQRAYTARFRP